ncbi:hypothetical protein Tco_0705399 [Tanacetum coccineum]|uniref:MULE transposase domain-containing protein n=1 Tax=Tanacetum coccineum TaxID=301880 RepID=A0ABQ4Y6G8_9ASTR
MKILTSSLYDGDAVSTTMYAQILMILGLCRVIILSRSSSNGAQVSCDGRKAVNETLTKAVKERWNKKKEIEKKGYLNKMSVWVNAEGKAVCIVDHEGGLVNHYSKLWQYRQAILDTNPFSTCVLENEVNDEDGKLHFSRDANSQMFLIAWAVVGVENNVNWSWFLSLIRDNLNLGDGGGIDIISDGHKGLLQAVADWLPNAEHIQCVRHIYANFKKRWSGLQFKRLFWGASATSMESVFL